MRKLLYVSLILIVIISSCKMRPPILTSCGIITNGNSFGSCVAIGPNVVLTAKHCSWPGRTWIEINGVHHEVIATWFSPTHDVQLAWIDGTMIYARLGQMPKLLDEVYLVGSPYNRSLQGTITKGVISHLSRDIYGRKDLIQTDAEGAPGSSGGPLFNTSGQIIGICVAGPKPGGGVTLCESVDTIRSTLGL